MVQITFKDVGQGDSILISWSQVDIMKVGIIDCHKYGGTNPVLDQIAEFNKEVIIEFIVISHGHRDHYSGVKELLNYCQNNKIVIQNFISTLHPTQFQFFDITLSYNEQLAIADLIKQINELEKEGVTIKNVFPAYNKIINFQIENLSFTCLHPKQADYTILGKKLDQYIKGKTKTKPDLNFISTIFKIFDDTFFGLFTSDCTVESLEHFERKDQDVRNKELQLTQVPHHGSVNNHYKNFWLNINRIENCPAVISSGASVHRLPNQEVVKDFIDLGYKIFSTNYVHGIKSYIEGNESHNDFSFMLDCFTELEDEFYIKEKDRFRGDKIFRIDSNGIRAV